MTFRMINQQVRWINFSLIFFPECGLAKYFAPARTARVEQH